MTKDKLEDADQLRLLKLLHERPDLTQREIAKEVGLSLGKVNYCLKALVSIGHIKAENFTQSNNKFGYVYLLTPKGVKEKASVTIRFLARKKAEYEKLEKEIEALKKEIETEKDILT